MRWKPGKKAHNIQVSQYPNISVKNGFYFLEGREGILDKREKRKKISRKKLKIANKATNTLSKIPSVKFVGVTGSLAMNNADNYSDVDLLVITSRGTLWTSRFLSFVLLLVSGFKIRRYGNINELDKLCINMWMDESDLIIRKRNIFTAHELAQIIPIVNKDMVYEKLLYKNKWILDYWPKAAKILSEKDIKTLGEYKEKLLISLYRNILISWLEPIAYQFQYQYMKPKITKETITKTRAFFHPADWSKKVLKQME